MTTEELAQLKYNVLNNGLQIREKQLDTKYIEIKELLLSYHGDDFEEKRYNFLYDIHTRPTCKNCGGYVKFAYSHGYNSYCSKPCETENIKKIKAARTPEEIEAENEKRRQTVKKKYGVEYVTQTIEHKDKIKETNNERYGGNAPTSSKEVIKTRQKNNMEKWGVKEFPETKEFKEKVRETCQKNWGYDSHLLHPDFQKISQDAMEEKYGVRFPYQNKEIRDKATEKCIIAIDNPEVREKQKRLQLYVRFYFSQNLRIGGVMCRFLLTNLI